jgi:hypothetical protein
MESLSQSSLFGPVPEPPPRPSKKRTQGAAGEPPGRPIDVNVDRDQMHDGVPPTVVPSTADVPLVLDPATVRRVLGQRWQDPAAIAELELEVRQAIRQYKLENAAGALGSGPLLVRGRPLSDWLDLDTLGRLIQTRVIRAEDSRAESPAPPPQPICSDVDDVYDDETRFERFMRRQMPAARAAGHALALLTLSYDVTVAVARSVKTAELHAHCCWYGLVATSDDPAAAPPEDWAFVGLAAAVAAGDEWPQSESGLRELQEFSGLDDVGIRRALRDATALVESSEAVISRIARWLIQHGKIGRADLDALVAGDHTS